MLIGICGRAGAGKDETANVLIRQFPHLSKYSLADPIKLACNTIFGWDERHGWGDLKEVTDPYWGTSPRHAYQTLGTEWGRKLIHPQIWIMKAQRELEKRGMMIVPDIRFENELDWLRTNKHILINVSRPNQSQIALSSHASEAGIDNLMSSTDIRIINDGSLGDLEQQIKTKISWRIADELRNTGHDLGGIRQG